MSEATTDLRNRPPTEEERRETMEKASKLIADMQMQALKRFPIELRVNYLLGTIAKSMEKAGETDVNKVSDTVNWQKVNEIINLETSKYDFNILSEIKNIQELQGLRERIIYATCGLGPWQKHTCKDCGEVFYMEKGEVDFFANKEFSIPARCKPCRDKRKKN